MKQPNENAGGAPLFDDTRMYTITQAARVWGITPRTLSLYCDKFPFLYTMRPGIRKKMLYGEQLNRLYYGKTLAATATKTLYIVRARRTAERTEE